MNRALITPEWAELRRHREAIPLKCNQSIRTVRNLPVYESVALPEERKPPDLFAVGLLGLVRIEVRQHFIKCAVIEISQLAKSVDPENVNV